MSKVKITFKSNNKFNQFKITEHQFLYTIEINSNCTVSDFINSFQDE